MRYKIIFLKQSQLENSIGYKTTPLWKAFPRLLKGSILKQFSKSSPNYFKCLKFSELTQITVNVRKFKLEYESRRKSLKSFGFDVSSKLCVRQFQH